MTGYWVVDSVHLRRGMSSVDGKSAKKAKIDVERGRKEQCITSGADIIIKNVIHFLQLAK
jgi:hypothetical protein